MMITDIIITLIAVFLLSTRTINSKIDVRPKQHAITVDQLNINSIRQLNGY